MRVDRNEIPCTRNLGAFAPSKEAPRTNIMCNLLRRSGPQGHYSTAPRAQQVGP